MSTEEKPTAPAYLKMSAIVLGPETERISTGIDGLDKCLSESDDGPQGIPMGTSILLSGMPGGGKSSIASFMAGKNNGLGDTLVLHGEEKNTNVKKRFERLKIVGDPYLAPLREVDDALDVIRELMAAGLLTTVVVDSIQTIRVGGKKKYDLQADAVEMLAGQVTSAGGNIIFVSHVNKSGDTHSGSNDTAHLVDIHCHVMTNAKKGMRFLEVRKNRHGRAGFEVPLNIGLSSLSVGTPAPFNATNGDMMAARTALESARDKAIACLLDGKRLTGYDHDEAGCSPGMWRAGLSMAVKSMMKEGHVIIETKVKMRTGWHMESPPKKEPAIEVLEGPPEPVTAQTAGVVLDMTATAGDIIVKALEDDGPLSLEMT